MIKTSKECRKKLQSENRYLEVADKIILADGTELQLNNGKILSYSISDATSSTNSFDIGAAIIGKWTATLNNQDGQYDSMTLEGASVAAIVSIDLEEEPELLRKGTYTIYNATRQGAGLRLEAYDNMACFDKKYDSILTYPATIRQIVQDACRSCGVILASKRWDNDDYVVNTRPESDALTYRDVISMAAQMCCKYARCSADGELELSWYGEALEEQVLLDENDEPILLDGDDEILLWDTVSREEMLNNTIEDDAYYCHQITEKYSLTAGEQDISITGAGVVYDQTTYLCGDTDYSLVIEDNDLIQSEEQAKEVAAYLYGKLYDMQFRTISSSIPSDPSIEAGDAACVTTRKGERYYTYVTNTTFAVGAAQSISCGAEAPEKNRSDQFSAVTKAYIKSQNYTDREISDYDKMEKQLWNLMTTAFGAYQTEEVQEDGSKIFYMHNKPRLEESSTIWKRTIDAIAVSTDGGKTWNAGVDKNGNAVLNILSVIGLNFDWIKGGTAVFGGKDNGNGSVKVLDQNGNVICQMNNNGAAINGRVTSKNEVDGFSVALENGKMVVTDKQGARICEIYLMQMIESDGSHWIATISGNGQNQAYITLDGKNGEIAVQADKFRMGSSAGVSGKVVFSNGTFLTLKNGIVIGGNSQNGSF